MIAQDGHYVDGSWLLSIRIDDLNLSRQIRVQGDWSTGKVLVTLTSGLSPPLRSPALPDETPLQGLPKIATWSEYALWWPAKHRWILQTHTSLDQHGLQSDAELHFICTHGRLKVQLPDLQCREFGNVSYTEPVFRILVLVCSRLGIKHPEELSFQRVSRVERQGKTPPTRGPAERWSTLPLVSRLTKSRQEKSHQRHQSFCENGRPLSCLISSAGPVASSQNYALHEGDSRRFPQFGPPTNSKSSPLALSEVTNMQGTPCSLYSGGLEHRLLATSPCISVMEAIAKGRITRSNSFLQRIRSSANWLELGQSLMEQGISAYLHLAGENKDSAIPVTSPLTRDERNDDGVGTNIKRVPMVRLQFKYALFYNLMAKGNAVRINQLYEQARWSIISEAIECTDEEGVLLAAIQLQLRLLSLKGDRISRKVPTDATINLTNQTDGASTLSDPSSDGLSTRTECVCLDREIDGLLEELTTACLKEHSLSTRTDNLEYSLRGGNLARSHVFTSSEEPSNRSQALNCQAGEIQLPELSGQLRICKPRHFNIKPYRGCYAVLKKTVLSLYKSLEELNQGMSPFEEIELLGCESYPQVIPAVEKYLLKVISSFKSVPLPLSSALKSEDTEEVGFRGRVQRRASLLSLTALGSLSAASGKLISSVSGLQSEIILRFATATSFVEWTSAIRVAGCLLGAGSRSPVTPDALRRRFDSEKRALSSLLKYLEATPQGEKGTDTTDSISMAARSLLLQSLPDFVPMRIGYDLLDRQNTSLPVATSTTKHEAYSSLIDRILEARSRLPELNATDLKLFYITRWQEVYGQGVAFFLARFQACVSLFSVLGIEVARTSTLNGPISAQGDNHLVDVAVSRKDEVLGIGNGRVARHNLLSGTIRAAWRFDNIHSWQVNRELNELTLLLAPKTGQHYQWSGARVIIRPLEVSVCKVAEVLGTNVFLRLRSPVKSQQLDERMFYRLLARPRSQSLASRGLSIS